MTNTIKYIPKGSNKLGVAQGSRSSGGARERGSKSESQDPKITELADQLAEEPGQLGD